MSVEVKIFSGTSSKYLAKNIAKSYGQSLGEMDFQRFSDGEFQPNILESVRGTYTYFIQATGAPAQNLVELLMMIDAAKRASAQYIAAVIPYYGFSRQDRKDKPRVAIGSKLIANLITAAGADRVITMDLHADQIQGFFDIPVDHLTSTAIFVPYIKKHLNLDTVVFASPDVGGTKRARAYSKYFGTSMVICDKYRRKANEIQGMQVIGDVEGMDVIIVDDIVDTANTLAKAAAALLQNGAKSVRAFCTHPVLSGQAYETIENSQLTELVVCDTIPYKRKSEKIKRLSVAELFATAIKHSHEHKSISSLFIENII